MKEICGTRTQDDGAVELLVKWKGGEEIWEPYENLAETEALYEYKRLYGRVGIDIIWDFMNPTAHSLLYKSRRMRYPVLVHVYHLITGRGMGCKSINWTDSICVFPCCID